MIIGGTIGKGNLLLNRIYMSQSYLMAFNTEAGVKGRLAADAVRVTEEVGFETRGGLPYPRSSTFA